MHSPVRHARSIVLKTRPIHLTWFVTRRCNARCPFCFYAEEREAREGPPELSLDEVRRVAGSLPPLLWVLFSGGEPFLRRDLVEASGVFHDVSRAPFLVYPTNGLLPEAVAETVAGVLRRCPESTVVVKLSLDGVGALHDELRRTPGGFARALRTYEALAALAARNPRLELGVNTVFCPENQWRLGELVELVSGLDAVRSHTLTLLRPAPGTAASGALDLGQYRAVSRQLAGLWAARGRRFHRFAGGRLKAAQDRLQRRLVHDTVAQRRRLVPCYAGRLDLVLGESGELRACETRKDLSFGNVRDHAYDVGAMLRAERARGVLAEIARGGCWCSHECNFITNILFNPRLHPALVGEWVRLGGEAHGSERSTAARASAPAEPPRR